MFKNKKYINEFNVGDVVKCLSGRYKIIKFKDIVVTTKTSRKVTTISASCLNENNEEIIISVNKNKNFVLDTDQSW